MSPDRRRPDRADLASEFARDFAEPEAVESADSPAAPARPSRSTKTTRPKFAQLRPEQQSALDDLARDLQDARTVRSERITANTLIRVAIDGLLRDSDRLSGDTEAELRASWYAYLDQAKKGSTARPQ